MRKLIFSLCVVIGLTGCEGDPSEVTQNSIDTGNASNFDPGNSIIPFPNDLLFLGQADGTINIPGLDETDLSDPQVAINGLDGFSTVAPMTTGFLGAIDPASVSASSVRVFKVGLSTGGAPGGAVVSITAELTYGLDFVATVSAADATGSTLAVVPLKPLDEKSHYYVVVTSALLSTSGNPMKPSAAYALAKNPDAASLVVGGVSQIAALTDEKAQALEPLRQLISTSESTIAALASPAITVGEIVISWGFTTQSITDVLGQVRTDVIAAAPASAIIPTAVTPSPFGAADIYVGGLNVPYYLAAASGVNDPAPLASYWKGAAGSHLSYLAANLSPLATSTETIPLMVSIPKSTKPTGGWPVLIYQHGITTNRTTMLAIADSMAAAGIAVVAIDLPLHGLTGNETDGTAPFKDTVNGERTFDLDLVTQDADGNITAVIPDGITDSSGRHYINLSNLLNTRDNVRQSVSDLFALTFALTAMDYDGGGADFDTAQISFLGHSLGGIVGTTFLAFETAVNDAVLAMGGGGVAKLLDGSASFGPSIAAGLAANGVIKGTADYESFLGAAQTVVDSGDPINHATAAATGRGILFFEVIGGSGSPSDLVVPNRVPDGNDTSGTIAAPLSGTDPLVGVDADIANTGLGLTQYDTSAAGPALKALVRYTAGDHGSILSPAANATVTTEMQTQAAGFVLTGNLAVTPATGVIAAP